MASQAFESALSPGAPGTAPVAALAARALVRMAQGDWKAALHDASDERLHNAAPATADLLSARAEAGLGHASEATKLLQRAIQGGLKRADLGADPAFESLRNDPDFRSLLVGASGN